MLVDEKVGDPFINVEFIQKNGQKKVAVRSGKRCLALNVIDRNFPLLAGIDLDKTASIILSDYSVMLREELKATVTSDIDSFDTDDGSDDSESES